MRTRFHDGFGLLPLVLALFPALTLAAPVENIETGMVAAQHAAAQFHSNRTEATPIRGNSSASITFTLVGDFDCPYTAKMYPVVQELLRRHQNTVKFVFKMLPIASHPQAFAAARRWSAVRVIAPEKVWPYFDGLFQGKINRELGEAYYERLDQELGIDHLRILSAIKSADVNGLIDADIEEVGRLGIHGVPTFLLNGVQVESGTVPIEALEDHIARLESGPHP